MAEHLKTPESRKHLARRLREAMIKCIILSGIPKVMLAFHSLAAVEQEQDQDHSSTRTTRGGFNISTPYTVELKTQITRRAVPMRTLDSKGPTDWNLKGCLRLGFTREEVDAVQKVIERIVTHGGGKLSQIGSVWDIQDK
ncbi:hypothetical protein B0T24DRAFT_706856 [Lasiosphaeria ovina]|uniref:Uncharacterized protein n=1 Tax=Lasiosphaeria ovina TaxID=92902 RepID=A0AAE0K7U6_9PEZI|nr:hypothetical protein B0T24DRAFT_706856 [Lasiosphaeria ovina]